MFIQLLTTINKKGDTMKHLIRKISILVPIIILFSCKQIIKTDTIILDRIEYIYNLKSHIDKDIWPEFSNHKFDIPLIYYSDSVCYATNPTEKFIKLFTPELVRKNQTLTIYKTKLVDSIPFHMEVFMTFGDSSSDYNYKLPFINCSSPELTGKYIPDVHSTELWASMAIHEYFHGFQFKHQFPDIYEEIFNVSPDTLNVLYRENDWFKKFVDEENAILLKALNSDSQSEIQQSIQQFFSLRDQRLYQTKELLKSDIKTVEQNNETMEGTARYVEYSLYSKFASLKPDIKLVKSDSLFHSYEYFKNYTITKDKWLYLTSATNYYYATGFNIARLLDKLRVDYKSRLFNEQIFLDEILREQIEVE